MLRNPICALVEAVSFIVAYVLAEQISRYRTLLSDIAGQRLA